MSDTYNFNEKTQFIKEAKDNVKIIQNNNGTNSPDFEKKLDEMLAKLDEKQSQEMESLVNQIISKIDESKLNKDKAKIVNDIKLSSDLKFKVKQGLPLEWFIKQATGTSFEIEKEWKVSKEIKPENMLGFFRKVLRHQELQATKFNEIEPETVETKLLPE